MLVWTEGRAQQLRERQEEELLEGWEEALLEGSSAGIIGGGDCRRNWRRQVLRPLFSPPVTPALCTAPLANEPH